MAQRSTLHRYPFKPGDLSSDYNAITPPSVADKLTEDKQLSTKRGPIAPRSQASYGREEAAESRAYARRVAARKISTRSMSGRR